MAGAPDWGAGYLVSFQDDFTTGLDIVGPLTPRGKYTTTRSYAINGGSVMPFRQPGTVVAHITDPLYTGHVDSNRGVPIGTNNLRQGGSILTAQARRATTAEAANFPTPATNLNIGTLLSTILSCVFYAATSAPVIVEARYRMVPSSANSPPRGAGPTFWTFSGQPAADSATMLEVDIDEAYSTHGTNGINNWSGGSISGGDHFDFGAGTVDDGNFHVLSAIISKDAVDIYVDGVLAQHQAVDGNPVNKNAYMLFQVKPKDGTTGGVTFTQADWDASGTTDNSGMLVECDWWRILRTATTPHYRPLVAVDDLSVAYAGTGSIVLPSKANLWGAAGATEYVQIVPLEIEEPGVTATTSYEQFPAGVTYDAGTRTISVDWAAVTGGSGCLHGAVYAYDTTGSTCEPARFTINRGPHVTTTALTVTTGVSYSKDIYPECDVGRMLPKAITVTGLPTGLSFSSTTGLITGTNSTPGDTTVTIGVTNNIGQTVSKDVTLTVGNAALVSTAKALVTAQAAENTHTWSAVDLGAADTNRYIVVGFGARAAAAITFTGVTIGGVTAAQLAHVANGNTSLDFWGATVPTGTTGDVVVNTDINYARIFGEVWAVSCSVAPAVTATANDVTLGSSKIYTAGCNVLAGGSILAIAYYAQASLSMVWTNPAERADNGALITATVGAGSDDYAAAHTPETLTVTASSNVGSDVGGLLAIALR